MKSVIKQPILDYVNVVPPTLVLDKPQGPTVTLATTSASALHLWLHVLIPLLALFVILLVIVGVETANVHLVYRVQVVLPAHIAMRQEIVEMESVSALHLSVLVMVSQQELIVMQVVIVEMEYANALLPWLRAQV